MLSWESVWFSAWAQNPLGRPNPGPQGVLSLCSQMQTYWVQRHAATHCTRYRRYCHHTRGSHNHRGTESTISSMWLLPLWRDLRNLQSQQAAAFCLSNVGAGTCDRGQPLTRLHASLHIIEGYNSTKVFAALSGAWLGVGSGSCPPTVPGCFMVLPDVIFHVHVSRYCLRANIHSSGRKKENGQFILLGCLEF